jgi:hypothetical protein
MSEQQAQAPTAAYSDALHSGAPGDAPNQGSAHGINKVRDTFTALINNSDHVIMQNKQTTADTIRDWINDGKVLAAAEQVNCKNSSATSRGNNDSHVPSQITNYKLSRWFPWFTFIPFVTFGPGVNANDDAKAAAAAAAAAAAVADAPAAAPALADAAPAQ